MKRIAFTLIVCFLTQLSKGQNLPTMNYSVDVSQNPDTLLVSLDLTDKVSNEDIIFQFAATAPGTYQTMNIGRFVSNLQAFDKKGRALEVSKESINQYKIISPKKLSRITYSVAETFDTPVEEYQIYLMCGTSIEEDHALLNAHAFLGYFEGMQRAPFRLKVLANDNWKAGTALELKDGYYEAKTFDHLVDSPILLGNLTVADTMIAETAIQIYTYSQNGLINSDMLLSNMADMLDAARKFLVELPVDRYTFLYHFEEGMSEKGRTGAWEHSYSSEYVLSEGEPTAQFLTQVTDIASHEFFHIVTPLNIHSEIVESFNFVTPTPSVHLWLYEGVTEWASNILLYRGDVVSREEYLANAIARKIFVDENYFDSSWSLKKLSDESFNAQGARQYANIYYRGSLVAGLLDIRLLELSNGERGLRELVLELIEKYGKGRPVSEATFFDDITEMTYPEIRDFFDEYVLDNQPLPHQEYLEKLGLKIEKAAGGAYVISENGEMSTSQAALLAAWSRNKAL